MKIAIVTGASSGMGREFVKQISKKYRWLDEIWVIARRKERLDELQCEVETNLKILPYDLTDDDCIEQLNNLLSNEKPNIRLLINASGYGKIGDFTELSKEDNIGMLDLNCRALTQITYICLPYMKKGARIIQLASSAGFIAQPRFAIYAATKSYVLSFSRALAHELKVRNISVTAVCPGPVKTEFFDLAEQTGKVKIYKKLVMADPVKVVKLAMKDSASGKEVSVYGPAIQALELLAKIVPHKLILNIMDIIK